MLYHIIIASLLSLALILVLEGILKEVSIKLLCLRMRLLDVMVCKYVCLFLFMFDII